MEVRVRAAGGAKTLIWLHMYYTEPENKHPRGKMSYSRDLVYIQGWR